MFCNTFECILRNLHLCDNKQLDKQNKLSKLRPFISELIRRLLKFSFNGENNSINESMIPYYGTHGSRQQINKKPVRLEYDILVLTKAYDYVFQFEPYQGVRKGKQFACPIKCRLRENVILWLLKCSPLALSYHIFKDNSFRSFHLLTHFVFNKIRGTGVVNKSSLRKCTITTQLQHLVIIYLRIIVSHLFICSPTLDLTRFEEQMSSTKIADANALSLETRKKRKVQKKKSVAFDSG